MSLKSYNNYDYDILNMLHDDRQIFNNTNMNIINTNNDFSKAEGFECESFASNLTGNLLNCNKSFNIISPNDSSRSICYFEKKDNGIETDIFKFFNNQEQSSFNNLQIMLSSSFSFILSNKNFNKKDILDINPKPKITKTNKKNILKKFPCPFIGCKKIYKSKENLTLHFRNIHLKEKPYSCKFCKSLFSHRNGKSNNLF